MSSNTLGKVVQRAISDAAFRRQLQSNPAAALRGFDLTADESAAIRSGDPARLSALGIDQRMSKAFAFGGAADTFTRATGNDFGSNATAVQDDIGQGTHDALVGGGRGDGDALMGGTGPSAADAATSGASGTVGDAVTGGDPSTGDAIITDGATLNTGAVDGDTPVSDAYVAGNDAVRDSLSSDTGSSDAFIPATPTHDLVLTGDEGSVDFSPSPDSVHDLMSTGDSLINDATGAGDALAPDDGSGALGGNDIPA